MQIQSFVSVAQRRILTIEDSLLPLFGPLFAIETHMTMEERVQLASLAVNLPERFSACEVGSYLGASACFIAAAATLKNGVLHCVDTWDNRAMGMEPPAATFEAFSNNTRPFSERIIVHQGESAAMAPQVPKNLDLVFIDSDHSYTGVKADLGNYGSKLRTGGLLLLHDFNYPEVQQATREFLASHLFVDGGLTHSLKWFVARSKRSKQQGPR